MAIAITLREYLDQEGINYHLVEHPYTDRSTETAKVAHVPGDQLAKSVVLGDENGYLVAVLPATHHLDLGMLHRQLHRRLGLATEQELAALFDDCDVGAVPPVGEAYGLEVVVDECLSDCPDVYFEAGDHTDLVHVSGEDFQDLMTDARHGHFSRHT